MKKRAPNILKVRCFEYCKTLSRLLSQSNDWYRGPTELVQHFTYRGSSHWRKGAASHIYWYGLGILLVYPRKEERVILLVQIVFPPAQVNFMRNDRNFEIIDEMFIQGDMTPDINNTGKKFTGGGHILHEIYIGHDPGVDSDNSITVDCIHIKLNL